MLRRRSRVQIIMIMLLLSMQATARDFMCSYTSITVNNNTRELPARLAKTYSFHTSLQKISVIDRNNNIYHFKRMSTTRLKDGTLMECYTYKRGELTCMFERGKKGFRLYREDHYMDFAHCLILKR